MSALMIQPLHFVVYTHKKKSWYKLFVNIIGSFVNINQKIKTTKY